MWKSIKKKYAPYLLYLITKFIYATNKKVYHHPKDDKEPFVLCMWHGDLLSQIFNYHHFRKGWVVKALISENRDGEIIAKTAALFNCGAVRGSSSHGASKVLIRALKELKVGNDVAITPDGPRGPRYSIADGVVIISQKSGKNIRCFNAIPSKYWQFNSWDKFVLPKPFGKIDFYISEPFSVKDMELEDAKSLIKTKMLQHSLI
ncbi:lysophospholipid acyltransferase family protein [Aliarcobacter cryaerophilus]|uniref:lysophospholipid acyltransferase family protein n=1 Tax=Aliarcobacter cryaerophilus TaxID=28198 RepID=UPI0021B4A45A|nr:lysophospholipid acyltransferase family protein [Aliarcobacter cryaerophilus]MCT7484607.1 lysophospholipid acyltransferase family protein [Aliarcobacter cryaerophilus]